MTRKVPVVWCEECSVRVEQPDAEVCPTCAGVLTAYKIDVARTIEAPSRRVLGYEVQDNGVWEVTTVCGHTFSVGPFPGVSPDDVAKIGCPICAVSENKQG